MTKNQYLINKYNQALPRYTSYPPANLFTDEFNAVDYKDAIIASNKKLNTNIAFYVHIPFCQQICYYCGCNATRTNDIHIIDTYFDSLKKEIKNISKLLDKSRKISQIHFGGGTPNSVPAKKIKEIINCLTRDFELLKEAEIAIECHPFYLTYEYIDLLLEAGINRFSIGVQDFNPKVLQAVNRQKSLLPIEKITDYIRKKSPSAGINIDLIYGLPLQNISNFTETIHKTVSIKPNRIVTFSYAHVPWIKKHQLILEKIGLPAPNVKMKLFNTATKILQNAGYKLIGFDHFARKDDELYKALDNKQLHRNFQGYCTLKTTAQVYAFGISGISQLDDAYAQNTKNIKSYTKIVNKGQLATKKGYKINEKQKIIREVINQIMCNKYINWQNLAKRLHKTPELLKNTVKYNPKILEELQHDELIIFNDNMLKITTQGDRFIRNIAAVFDTELQTSKHKYSKTV